MEARRALITAFVAIVGAGLGGAAFAGDEREAKCADRCEETLAECESEAETRYDECAKAPRKLWIECACGADVVPEDLPPHCVKQCVDSQKALDKCNAKREKRRDRCVEKRDRCADACSD